MISNLYLVLMLVSFSVPFIFSFHKRLAFYKHWKALSFGILGMMLVFIPWDIYFTSIGVWGFNDDYLTSIYIFNLPIEEWMFFIMIPYACIFTHYSLKELLPKFELNKEYVKILVAMQLLIFSVLLIVYFGRWYSTINLLYAIIITIVAYYFDKDIFIRFPFTYLVILLPFFVVNGVLTGSLIESPIVWYNDGENFSKRFFTIPFDDFIYNYSMLLSTLFFMRLYEFKSKSF